MKVDFIDSYMLLWQTTEFDIFFSQFEIGSNMTVSALVRLIKEFYEDHKFLPKILHINADNCGRENKARTVYTIHTSTSIDISK